MIITIGLGTTKDGWQQSYIEYKGYNTRYEDSKNLIPKTDQKSELIDCDGPWVYRALQHFIYLYYNEEQNISLSSIQNYVKQYYSRCNEIQQQNIVQQLLAFQHDIINKQDYVAYDFQEDQYDNQFTLYKHKKFNKYEDSGQIWVRLKNYPLSMPLMNYVQISDFKTDYKDDKFDILQINEHIDYANMWKELCNNAIQFGVIKSTIWVLGYSSYTELNGQIIKQKQGCLKLGVLSYNENQILNTLNVETTKIRFFSCQEHIDILYDIVEFIGVYFNKFDLSLEFVLYDKQKHIQNLKNEEFKLKDNDYNTQNIIIPVKVRKI